MNSKYCLSCNAKTTFDDVVPKYCVGCGKPFASTAVANISAEIKVAPRQVEPVIAPKPKQSVAAKSLQSRRAPVVIEDSDDDNYEESVQVPEISKLDFEITGSNLSSEELLEQRGHNSYKDIKNSPFRERTSIRNIAKTSAPIVREKSNTKGKKVDIKKFNQEFYGEVVKVQRGDVE